MLFQPAMLEHTQVPADGIVEVLGRLWQTVQAQASGSKDVCGLRQVQNWFQSAIQLNGV